MKLILVHNTYQHPGGEDVVFEQERQMLERAGHKVIVYRRSNHEMEQFSKLKRITQTTRLVWARDSRLEFDRLVAHETPELVHVHNTFFMISPAVYGVCQERDIPVVQTLHNFRLLCPAATFFRDGEVCEECTDHSLWRGIYHGCYRDSRPTTAAVALMLTWHRLAGTWSELVDCYIALSDFSRNKFVAAGFPAEKVFVKPNFVDSDPGERSQAGDYALSIGRLSPEKGISVLLQAWEQLPHPYPLQVVGDGPERERLEAEARQRGLTSAIFRGRLSREQTIAAIKGACFLVQPSECFENFPMSIAESFACGTPVLCSRLGGMEEIVSDHRTGLLFTAGDPGDLAQKVVWSFNHPTELAAMGREARRQYENQYTSANNYSLLMEIYQKTLTGRSKLTPHNLILPQLDHDLRRGEQ